jgi:hypothetical protein
VGAVLSVAPLASEDVQRHNRRGETSLGGAHSQSLRSAEGDSSCRDAWDPGSKVDVDKEEAVGKKQAVNVPRPTSLSLPLNMFKVLTVNNALTAATRNVSVARDKASQMQ